MPEVVFYPQNKSINVEEGTTILQAARSAGVIIESRATVQELAENAK